MSDIITEYELGEVGVNTTVVPLYDFKTNGAIVDTANLTVDLLDNISNYKLILIEVMFYPTSDYYIRSELQPAFVVNSGKQVTIYYGYSNSRYCFGFKCQSDNTLTVIGGPGGYLVGLYGIR